MFKSISGRLSNLAFQYFVLFVFRILRILMILLLGSRIRIRAVAVALPKVKKEINLIFNHSKMLHRVCFEVWRHKQSVQDSDPHPHWFLAPWIRIRSDNNEHLKHCHCTSLNMASHSLVSALYSAGSWGRYSSDCRNSNLGFIGGSQFWSTLKSSDLASTRCLSPKTLPENYIKWDHPGFFLKYGNFCGSDYS